MNAPPNREVALFSAALELPASERAAYLDAACAGDPALRQRLDALLAVHEKAITFLEGSTPGAQGSRGRSDVAGATMRVSAPLAEKAGPREYHAARFVALSRYPNRTPFSLVTTASVVLALRAARIDANQP